METEKYCELVYDVLTLIDGFAVKSKRDTIGSDKAWFEFVQGYAGILASACVAAQDIKPAALLHVKKSQFFPAPSELIELSKGLAYERRKAENPLIKSLPGPAEHPITAEERAEILQRLELTEQRLMGRFDSLIGKAKEFSGEKFEESEERRRSIERARLKLVNGGG